MMNNFNKVRKAIREAIIYCRKLINPKVFNTLVVSMMDGIEVIIKADGLCTKY